MKHKKQGGFTLIEAAVAIAVVAILSGVIVPLVIKNIGDSQDARVINDVNVIAAAVAKQLANTGVRPTGEAAANKGTAEGAVVWHSGSSTGNAPMGVTLTADNSFVNLFCADKTDVDANLIFKTTAGAEFSYKGPYLANDVASKTDTWSTSYLILGYNATGHAMNGPIWVVSAGPNKSVNAANTAASLEWLKTGDSADDIAIRVN